jgi:flagellar L-ring protein precursor FlgH
MLGYEGVVRNAVPAVGVSPAVAFGTEHETKGDGGIDRQESIDLTFAAIVTQVLPNGLLAIVGRQEIRVNYELRELMISGVIRPQDIEADNSIRHEKIAEMRVAYGGRGTLSDLQQPRWGTQIWDIIFPF